MRRKPNKYDAVILKRTIYNNNGVIGCARISPNKSNQEVLKDFINSQIEFLEDGFMFDVNDVCYIIDPKDTNNLLIKLNQNIYDELKSYLNSLNK